MPIKRGSKAGMVFGFLAAAVLFSWGVYSLVGGIRSESWVSTAGQIVESDGSSSSEHGREFVYTVGSVTYLGGRESFGGGFRKRTAAGAQKAIATARRIEAVTVWHDPADPSASVLRKGVSRGAFFLMAFALPFAFAGWYSSRVERPANPTRLRDLPEILSKIDFSRENLQRGLAQSRKENVKIMLWYRPGGVFGAALRWLYTGLALGSFALGMTGFVVVWTKMQHRPEPFFFLAGGFLVGSFFFLAAATVYKRWQVTRGFPRRPAKTVERAVSYRSSGDNGSSWEPAVRCAYEFGGAVREERVMVAFGGWRARTAAEAYLDSRIGPAGDCELAVNPDNPAEAYLVPLPAPWGLAIGGVLATGAMAAACWFLWGSGIAGRHAPHLPGRPASVHRVR